MVMCSSEPGLHAGNSFEIYHTKLYFAETYRITSIKRPLLLNAVEAAPSFNLIDEENDDEELEIL